MGHLPALYNELSEEQQKGEEYIFPGLPAVLWRADLAGARSVAETCEALGYATISPRHQAQPTWRTLRTWKRLAKLGFIAVEVKTPSWTVSCNTQEAT